MRKLLLITGMVLLAAASVTAQPERIGAGLTFATKKRLDNGGLTGNPGINIRTWIPLDKRLIFHVVPSVTVFNPLENSGKTGIISNTYMFFADLDFQARLLHDKTLKLVALAGVNYTYIISKNEILIALPDPPEDQNISGFGPSLGTALEMRMSAQWDFIVSARYAFGGLKKGDATADEPFLVAPLSSPIIQVHGVYYFKSRGRGYFRK
ncbi:MAG: hypothetical protein K9G38_01655 [Bacteroidales bacterium]|nr:hypothetical protein [Bacteroidales bacterium]